MKKLRSKKIFILLLAIFLIIGISGCDMDDTAEEVPEVDYTEVGIVFTTGGLEGDFNVLAYRGLEQAADDMNVKFDYVEPESEDDYEPSLQGFAEQDYDLVLAMSIAMEEATKKVSQEYPDINFANIDGDFEPAIENVKGIVFAEDEGSFLAGALAGYATETGNVGFIGGVDFPLIHQFEEGFKQGTKFAGEEIEVHSEYTGSFADEEKAEKIAREFIEEDNADIIYHAAGRAGRGLFAAVEDFEEEDVFAIGVDNNQNYISPGNIIASMVKRIDEAVYATVEDVVEGNFEGGVNIEYGLAEEGVGLTTLEAEVEEIILPRLDQDEIDKIINMKEEVTVPHADKIEDIKQKVIEGEIEVSN